MSGETASDARWRRPILVALLGLAVLVGSRGLTDESAVMLGGDMARYMMDGVFVHDLIADGGAWSRDELTRYAERYYARYPALSLGHHPPLPYLALVPFFGAFGISSFAARLAALSWFLLATWALYAFARRLFDWRVASWATALFVTNVFVLRAGQYVLSEMPMVALALVSAHVLQLCCTTPRPRYFVLFATALAASLYAKQLAVFMFPVYGVIVATHLGWRALFSRRILLVGGAAVLLASPLIVMTLALAPSPVATVTGQVSRLMSGTRVITAGGIVERIVTTQLSLPIALVALAGAAVLVIERDRRVAIGLIWIASVIGGMVVLAGDVEPARYATGVMPAYFLLAAGLAGRTAAGAARWAPIVVLAGAVTWQVWLVRNVRPSGAGGYETAARYVTDHASLPVVLYDSAVDTGYFVFFVRKHDPAGRLVVLRADKLLVPGEAAAAGGDERNAGSIYTALRRFGVQYVVVEERHRGPVPLQTLHEELQTTLFVERKRIPIATREAEARGVDLVIYEYANAQPADPDAELDIDIPVGRREIKLRLRDLIGAGGG